MPSVLRPAGNTAGPEDRRAVEGTRVLPIGSLESLLKAIGEQATRSLLTIAPQVGASHARRNAEQAAAAVRAERRELDEVVRWLAQRDLLTPVPLAHRASDTPRV